MLLDHIRREKGKQRCSEKKAKIGVEDAVVALFHAVNQVMMIDPVNSRKRKGQQIDKDDRSYGDQSRHAVLMRDLQLQHHDGDNDRQHAV